MPPINRFTLLEKRIRKGDHLAFSLLYSKFYPGMCLIGYKYTGRIDISQEIVQDVFLKIWEKREEIEFRGSIQTYLFASVKNGALNYLKHMVIERKYTSSHIRKTQNILFRQQISQLDGNSIVISRDIETRINMAIDRLPPKCRKIFLMNRQEHKKHSEIAEKLNLSINTVQRHISLALSKIRRALDDHQ